jgi:hypothetical protein
MPIVPECTSQVRRSTSSNKYDGFNHENMSEAKPVKSNVKQRKVPVVQQKIQNDKKLPKTAILQIALLYRLQPQSLYFKLLELIYVVFPKKSLLMESFLLLC